MADCSENSNDLVRVAGRVFRRVKKWGQGHLKGGQVELTVWGDSTLQALCERETQQGPIQGDAVYSAMCDPRIQYCIYQLTVNQIGRRLICCIK